MATRTRRSHRVRRHKKAGSSCGTKKMAGGRKSARRTHRKRSTRRGGMGMAKALGGIVKTALVPFGLFAAQKSVQKSKK